MKPALLCLLACCAAVGLGIALWPKPVQWAQKNACGSYCVYGHCPKGFAIVRRQDHNLEQPQWSIDAYNNAQGAYCKLDFRWRKP